VFCQEDVAARAIIGGRTLLYSHHSQRDEPERIDRNND
jgi:hypothetical protein